MVKTYPLSDWEKGKLSPEKWSQWEAICEALELDFPAQLMELFEPQPTVQTVFTYHEEMNDIEADLDQPAFPAGNPPQRSGLLQRTINTNASTAISELLDNTFDAYIANINKKYQEGLEIEPLKVRFEFLSETDGKDCVIKYSHNNGGFTKEQFDAFISYSHSFKQETNDEKIGVWGVGQKIAMATLGRANSIVVYVHFEDTDRHDSGTYVAQLGRVEVPPDACGGKNTINGITSPRNFYHPKNTATEVLMHKPKAGKQIGQNETKMKFRLMPTDEHNYPTSAFEDLTTKWGIVIEEIRQRYANKVQEIWKETSRCMGIKNKLSDSSRPSVIFKTTQDEKEDNEILPTTFEEVGDYFGDFDEIEQKFVHPPGLEPRRYKIHHNEVTLDVLIGMLPDDTESLNGSIMMWGNGRLFTDNYDNFSPTDNSGFYGDAQMGKGYKKTNQEKWWACYIKFTSKDPSLIPWNEGTKNGHMESSLHVNKLNEIYTLITWPYIKASKAIKGTGHGTILHPMINIFKSTAELTDLTLDDSSLFDLPTNQQEFDEFQREVNALPDVVVMSRISKFLDRREISTDEVTLGDENKGAKDWYVDTKVKLNTKKINFKSDFLSKEIKNYNTKTENCISPRNFASYVYPEAFLKEEVFSDEEE